MLCYAKSLQSCLTLCDPIDGSLPGSPIPGILQANTLEWVAISFSHAWKWKVKVKSPSRVRLLATPCTAAHQAPPSMGFSRQEYWSGVPLPSPYNIIVFIFFFPIWWIEDSILLFSYLAFPWQLMTLKIFSCVDRTFISLLWNACSWIVPIFLILASFIPYWSVGLLCILSILICCRPEMWNILSLILRVVFWF